MGATLAEVLRTFGPDYLREHALSTAQARAWRAIVACRTPALGGHLQQCDQCGQQRRLFHSCRNRHCPQCQNDARDAWRQAQLADLLPVPYCHLVFTLPHVLNGLAQAHPRWVYGRSPVAAWTPKGSGARPNAVRPSCSRCMRCVAGIDIANCPHCQRGRWLTIEVLAPMRHTGPSVHAQCRGPP